MFKSFTQRSLLTHIILCTLFNQLFGSATCTAFFLCENKTRRAKEKYCNYNNRIFITVLKVSGPRWWYTFYETYQLNIQFQNYLIVINYFVKKSAFAFFASEEDFCLIIIWCCFIFIPNKSHSLISFGFVRGYCILETFSKQK